MPPTPFAAVAAPVIGPRLTCAAGLRLAAIGLSLTRGAWQA